MLARQLWQSAVAAGQFTLQSHVLLIRDNFGSSIDLAFGGMPLESRMIERSNLWGVPGSGKIRTCSAEDLVTLIAFATRPQDWIDVEKVIIRQASKLNREQIEVELEPLVKLREEPEIMDNLNHLFQEHP